MSDPDQALLARWGRPVPRYTSYPTAPHFAPLPAPAVYVEWLAAVPAATELSLYLHVPFCHSLCLFCGCHTAVVHRREPVAAYAANLRAEAALLARALGGRRTVRHLHWGGGTPTMLGPEELAATMGVLAEHFAFAEGAEIAIEVDPRHVNAATAQVLGSLGFTRASLGVQDFDPLVQQGVGRRQPFAQVSAAADRLRRAGLGGINFDLMYGLPRQTEASVADTAALAVELAPDRLAVFGYAHVPWMKRHQNLMPAELPDPAARYRQQQAIARVLTGAGYAAVGFDHFAKPDDPLARAAAEGRLRRNFQGYTSDPAPVLLGLGASAIGTLPGAYVQNAARVPQWSAAVREGRLPVARGRRLSAEDRLRRGVIEDILCRLHSDLSATPARRGLAMQVAPALAAFAADGLISWGAGRLAVTPRGRPFLRTIAAAFDAYHRPEEGAARHSQAV